jgi:hypothetical protein
MSDIPRISNTRSSLSFNEQWFPPVVVGVVAVVIGIMLGWVLLGSDHRASNFQKSCATQGGVYRQVDSYRSRTLYCFSNDGRVLDVRGL